MRGFRDKAKCPCCGHSRIIFRMGASAGKIVKNFCTKCSKRFMARAGFPKEGKA